MMVLLPGNSYLYMLTTKKEKYVESEGQII